MLSARHLRKSYNARQVLAIDEFTVDSGECALVCGANGSGKTTILKILAGLLLPDSVEAWRFNGQDCRPSVGGIKGVMLLHQMPYMLSASARSNVAMAGGDTDAAMAWAGLTDMAKMAAPLLSGGLRQRLSLARAYAARPKLCLLDEPQAHLDADGAKLAADLIRVLCAEKSAVVVATPDDNGYFMARTTWHLRDGALSKIK